jgi:hypothetical protein
MAPKLLLPKNLLVKKQLLVVNPLDNTSSIPPMTQYTKLSKQTIAIELPVRSFSILFDELRAGELQTMRNSKEMLENQQETIIIIPEYC